MEKIKKFSQNKIIGFFLLVGVTFTVVSVVLAVSAIPNPGHDISTLGGYGATGDILYGTNGTTGGVSGLADVAVGKYLRSGGVGAVPVWSTPALPNTATSRKVLVGDGTNWVESTETYAVPGTAGNLMQSNGTNWISATPRTLYNQSVTTPAAGFAADTYLVGSSITIPSAALKVGTRYHLIFNVSKTAAGLATPIINVRLGTGGVVGDASKCALTWTAQTAVVDTGTFEVWATFRTVGSGTTAVLQCSGQRRHGASITGLGTLVGETKVATSAGFDSTVANSIIGASVNGGASAAWTITLVEAELENIN